MTALAEGMPVGRTAISMHLKVLRDAGLVADTVVGNKRVYRLKPETLQALRDHLDWYWEKSLSAYQRAANYAGSERQVDTIEEVVVTKSVRVQAPLAVAFDIFVGHEWWPIESHHIAKKPGVVATLQPFPGGRWFERAEDGSETDWGKVTIWQPPHRILLTWQVSAEWTPVDDPLQGSVIEVTFVSLGPSEVQVDLIHRQLQRYGDETSRMRSILEEKGGEPLESYARYVDAMRKSEDGERQ